MTFAAISGVKTTEPTQYDSSLDYARAFCEVAALIGVFGKGFAEIYQWYSEGWFYLKDFTNYFDWASIFCLVAVVPLRWNDFSEQWQLFGVGYLIWILNIFKYAVISRKFYGYSQTPKRMASRVFPQFTVVFFVILLAFSGSFLLVLKGENSLGVHDETSDYWKILFTGVRILIEGESVVDYTGPDGYKVTSTILITAFLFVSIVVLLNILIAQLLDTYNEVQENIEGGFLVARLSIIVRAKRNWFFKILCRYNKSEVYQVYYDRVYNEGEKKSNALAIKDNIKSINDRLNSQAETLTKMQETLKDIMKRLEPNTTKM